MRLRLLLSALGLAATLSAAPAELPDGLYAEFVTPRGDFTCELLYRDAPLTVTNFAGLAEGRLGPAPGKPFYDGLTFHRVVPGFVIQGGDPLGTGEGGPGYEFPDEFKPGLRHDDAGILSMANDGPDTNGSQFFLTLAPVNRLNYLHSVFGRTVRGREVLAQIRPGDVITAVHIRRIGTEAQAFRDDAAAFAARRTAARPYVGAREPGPDAPFDDPAGLLPSDVPRARHFNFKLANFARATGRTLAVRVYPKFDPATPGQKRADFARALAARLGTGADGALALYFADEDRWFLWLGDAQMKTFARPGQKMHDAKAALEADARARAVPLVAAGEARATPERPFTAADRLKCGVDAMLDTLIFRLEARP